jgi:hypothetical protein
MYRLLTKVNYIVLMGGKKVFLFSHGIIGNHGMMWEKQIHDYPFKKKKKSSLRHATIIRKICDYPPIIFLVKHVTIENDQKIFH